MKLKMNDGNVILGVLVYVLLVFKFENSAADVALPYLSQEYIDTIVQNAYFAFISASEYTTDEIKQRRAIDHAKQVALSLKKLAHGDPNRSYVLWRVAELEQQIFLEEEELFLKKLYLTQKEVNSLCDKFNEEIGKWRPNFANLIAIHSQMLNLDQRKADELSLLIEERDRNISREVSYSLEKALLAENYDKADEEFNYIRKNRKHLYISEDKYVSIEKRMLAKEEADDIAANLGTYLNEINSVIVQKKFVDAKRNLDFLHSRLSDARIYIPYQKYSEFIRKVRESTELVTRIEDSLVLENLELVNAGRADAAIDFLEKVLRRSGVANDKINMVNKAIMEMPGGHRYSSADKTVNQELMVITSSTEKDNGFSFNAVEAKVQLKRDSVKAYQEQQARIAQAEWERTHKREMEARKKEEERKEKMSAKVRKEILKIYTLLEENKVEKAGELFLSLRETFKSYSNPETFESLEKAIAQSRNQHTAPQVTQDKNREKAQQVKKEIVTFLDKKQIEQAYATFQKLRTPLQKYVGLDEFAKLENKVVQAYEAFQREKQSRAPQQQQPQLVSATKAPAPSPESATPAVAASKEDVYAAFDNAQKEAQLNAQEKATKDVMEIYSLLESNQVTTAYEYFKRNQIPLKTYVNKEAFDVLESTVMEAYNSVVQTMR